MQHKAVYLLFCKFTLHVSGVSHTHHRSTQNCNYSLRYCAATSLQRGQLGGSCTKNMTSTGGCSYSFVYSWWRVWLTPETCRVNLQNNRLLCVASRWTIVNIQQFTAFCRNFHKLPLGSAVSTSSTLIRQCVLRVKNLYSAARLSSRDNIASNLLLCGVKNVKKT